MNEWGEVGIEKKTQVVMPDSFFVIGGVRKHY